VSATDVSTTNASGQVGSSGQVPATGSSTGPILVWGLVLLVAGRMVLLSGRRIKVLPPETR
jgi:LPXTG-motif cell wall-anchored protein